MSTHRYSTAASGAGSVSQRNLKPGKKLARSVLAGSVSQSPVEHLLAKRRKKAAARGGVSYDTLPASTKHAGMVRHLVSLVRHVCETRAVWIALDQESALAIMCRWWVDGMGCSWYDE